MKTISIMTLAIAALLSTACVKDKQVSCTYAQMANNESVSVCAEVSTKETTRFDEACKVVNGTNKEEACDTSSSKAKCTNSKFGLQEGVTLYFPIANAAAEAVCTTSTGTYSTI